MVSAATQDAKAAKQVKQAKSPIANGQQRAGADEADDDEEYEASYHEEVGDLGEGILG